MIAASLPASDRMSAAAYRALMGAPSDADKTRAIVALAEHVPERTDVPVGIVARGHLAPRKMNGTEAAYDRHLWALRAGGDVLWHDFEALKLRLADDTFYTPDFAVLRADLTFEFHEVKGAKAIFRDDAKVKIKAARAIFPFRFFVVYPKDKKRSVFDVEAV